jgi:hypothetical protein
MATAVDLQLGRGSAEFAWIGPGAFHPRRTLESPLAPPVAGDRSDPVSCKTEDTPAALHLRSQLLDVALQRRGLFGKIGGPDGGTASTARRKNISVRVHVKAGEDIIVRASW